MKRIGQFGLAVVVLTAACTSFDSADAPASPAVVGEDGGVEAGADGSAVNGQPTGAPGTPRDVSVSPVPVVATVTTLAGSGTRAFAEGTGAAASFAGPEGVATDSANNLYVADAGNQRIRKIAIASKQVATLAGSGVQGANDGSATTATFKYPGSLAVDSSGVVYVADTFNNKIRKVTAAGAVSTLAGSGEIGDVNGAGTTATFSNPDGIAVDGAGNLYVADSGFNLIRKVSATGNVTTLAGSGSPAPDFADGLGAAAMFGGPQKLALSGGGDIIVADLLNQRIRKVTVAGLVTTIAGSGLQGVRDGAATVASFDRPRGITVDRSGNIYVSEQTGHRIRRVASDGSVTTLAGSGTAGFADGVGAGASFNAPGGLASDIDGVLYVADTENNRIRKLALVGIGQLRITWSPPSSTGTALITGYSVTASAAGHAPAKCTSASSATACTIEGLASGVAYSVSAVATNGTGAGASSAPVPGKPN